MPITNIRVKMVGEDGNSFAIMGRVRKALRRGGRSDLVEEFTDDAMSGDYDHLLQTVLKYVETYGEEEWEDEEEEDNYE